MTSARAIVVATLLACLTAFSALACGDGTTSTATSTPVTTGTSAPVISLQIAFDSARDGDWEIYVMRADGSDVRQLTDNDAGRCFSSLVARPACVGPPASTDCDPYTRGCASFR